jgi:murein DD-endopeptidase MepM/ murein hydrolase activator NlpD
MPLLTPMASYTLTQRWGATANRYEPAMYGYLGRASYNWKPYPFKKYYHWHPAVDHAAPYGTPIRASETGIITAIGYNRYSPASGLRYNIRIRNSPTVIYGGGHMSRIGKNPRTGAAWAVGQKILRGEIIGYCGHTGTATGNHVHFFVQINGVLYDPRLFFSGGYNQYDWRIKPVY